MLKSKIFLMVAVAAAGVFGYPTWMWIGNGANDDYNATGGPSLTQANAEHWGGYMYTNGLSYIQTYGGPTPYNNWTTYNSSSTRDAFLNSTGRKNADLVVISTRMCGYGAAGNPRIFMGNGSGYGNLYSTEFGMGQEYNRWVMAVGPGFLSGAGYSHIDPMFQGLQVLMGYEFVENGTPYWAEQWVPNYFSQSFWWFWTGGGQTVWDAWRLAVYTMADDSNNDTNIKMFSSYSPSNYHYYSDDTWSAATSEKGTIEAWRILTASWVF